MIFMTKKTLKELALARTSGYRYREIPVPEWEGQVVILREPSAEAWLRWQDIQKSTASEDGDDPEISVSEKAKRNLSADVTLFIDILCDEDKIPVFTVEDIPLVESVYGPVHSRLLKQALDLITSGSDAEKK